MIEEVRGLCDGFVDATFEGMRPQPLVNDRTGELEEVFGARRFPNRPAGARSLNTYYATPEVHDHAAGLIVREIAKEA
jgi:hypothetical protein